ncbi:MAG: hypothetical protein AB8G86_15500 [Saprospiraceae bacterium]
MRVPLLFLSFFMFAQTAFAQIGLNDLSAPKENLPLRYFGHLEINGLIPLKNAPVPNHLAFETKYWLTKTPLLKSSLGFGWQMGFNEGFAASDFDFTIDGLAGNELSYLYNYVSIRYKVMQSQRKIRPYAEVGGGWLLITDKFVDRTLNPDYDQNHTCDDGPSEYLRNTRLIRAQNRLALDAEIGLNFQVNPKVSLNLGVGGILTNPIVYLKKGYLPSALETRHATVESYQFRERALHSTSLKIGVVLLLFTDPNIVRTTSEEECFLIDFDSSDSCN